VLDLVLRTADVKDVEMSIPRRSARRLRPNNSSRENTPLAPQQTPAVTQRDSARSYQILVVLRDRQKKPY